MEDIKKQNKTSILEIVTYDIQKVLSLKHETVCTRITISLK